MKKITLFLAACTIVAISFAQTTGRIENLKDGWGTPFNYVGEIKSNQPSGLGVAIYTTGSALRYAGNFVSGQFNGKGVLLFSDGTFLSGEWKNGKLNGKGANLNKDGDIYVGGWANGKKDGQGRFVYADKSILTGSMKNDDYDGRCIYINAAGLTIADNIYSGGKKNGAGYQYELDSKKLFEGTWNDGSWASNGTASYASFLKSDKFYAEKTDNQILMGSIDKANKDLLQDTAFFYNLKNYNRYFGYYDKGYLADGIIVKDSSRFFGRINDNGAYGLCSHYKIKKYYDEGNYEDDYLRGSNNLSIDLEKKTVYYGTTTDKGAFTGKAWFVNNYNEVLNGNFEKGAFTGSGYTVFSTGKTIKGIFKDGLPSKITSFTDEKGVPIDLKPKSFETALNLVVGEYKNDFVVFKGSGDPQVSTDDYYNAVKSIISFPGSVGENFVFENYDFTIGYNADFYKGNNFEAAKAKYDKLCKDIAAANIRLKGSASSIKPTAGTVKKAIESKTTRTKFTLSNSGLSAFNIYASLRYENGDYTVGLVAGDVTYKDDDDNGGD